MSLTKQTDILAILIVSFLPSLVLEAQTKRLTISDRTRIIQAILKREKFRDSETWRDELQENTVFILTRGNISPDQVPRIDGIKFELITQQQVEDLKKTGIEYYRVGNFKFRNSQVRVSVIREYMNIAGRHANGSVTEYTCHKVAGTWRVSGRMGAVYTAESN